MNLLIPAQDEDGDEDIEETQQSTVDNYIGVSIKVRVWCLRVLVVVLTMPTTGVIQLESG